MDYKSRNSIAVNLYTVSVSVSVPIYMKHCMHQFHSCDLLDSQWQSREWPLLHMEPFSHFMWRHCHISAFRRRAVEVSALLRCYIIKLFVRYRRFGTLYQVHLQGSKSQFFLEILTLDDETDRLSRNLGNPTWFNLMESIPLCLPVVCTNTGYSV